MPRYRLHLHDGPTTPTEDQYFDVTDAEDAKDLAQIALLATQKFTHVEVWEGERLVAVQKRDGFPPDA